MLAFTVLLVACVVAGSSATKVRGVSSGRLSRYTSGSIGRQVALAPRRSIQGYRMVNPSRYTQRTYRRTLPSPKYGSYSSGIGTYATNMYDDDSQGVLGTPYLSTGLTGSVGSMGSMGSYAIPTAYQTGFASPIVTGSSPQGYYTNPGTYQTSGTYNIGLGSSGTTFNDDASSLYLLNQPTYRSSRYGSSRRMVPMSKKAGHGGSY